jgi:uncharacterized protein (TIGR03000 family)
MYSVVMLLSMTAAPEAPNFGGKLFGGHGCYSSGHGCYSSGQGCYSSGQGCYSSCHGCYASGYAGYPRGHGSCYGGGILNYTGCYGSYGGYPTYNCHGYGIYGGATYNWPNPTYYPGAGCYGYGYPIVPVYPKVDDKKEPVKDPKKTFLPVSPDQGRVIVQLPNDAKLYANGHLTSLTSGQRDFTTPAIERGRDYQYAMKIEYVRDGKTITDTKLVRVRAGSVSVVDFADQGKPEMVASTVKVNLPSGAKLFVENQLRDLPSGTNEFKTPELQKGSDYAYTFRAELTKDGKNQTQTQRVVFKAGEPINVDFREMEATRTASK